MVAVFFKLIHGLAGVRLEPGISGICFLSNHREKKLTDLFYLHNRVIKHKVRIYINFMILDQKTLLDNLAAQSTNAAPAQPSVNPQAFQSAIRTAEL